MRSMFVVANYEALVLGNDTLENDKSEESTRGVLVPSMEWIGACRSQDSMAPREETRRGNVARWGLCTAAGQFDGLLLY